MISSSDSVARTRTKGGASRRGPTYAVTSPNRRCSSQSVRACAISSGVRATKFHHIRTVSGNGGPPISKYATSSRLLNETLERLVPRCVQVTVFQRLTLDGAVTTQDQRGMLVAGIQTQLHTASGVHLDIGADEVGIVRPGRL